MEWRLKHLEEEKRQEKARMQRVLADSVSQVENQNEFASHLELELENLKSTVRKEDSRVSHLRQRLSDSLREVGQAPGEDMALEDLLSIANSALRLAPGRGSQDNKPVRAHHDSLGHEVFSMPDTPPIDRDNKKEVEKEAFPYYDAYEEEAKYQGEIYQTMHDSHALDAAGQVESKLRHAFDRIQSMRE